MWRYIKEWVHALYPKKRIYLDFAAATPVPEHVRKAMEPYWSIDFGNPSSIHSEGVCALSALRAARKRVARALRVREEEVVFTSGGTESNNLAICGVLEAARERGLAYGDMHVITSTVEHVSVLRPLSRYEKQGVSVTYLDVDEAGLVSPQRVAEALTPQTILVSLMYVNNEIGTLTPIRKIAELIRTSPLYAKQREGYPSSYPLVHTDASQAPLFFDVAPERLEADLLTVDAQKLYGPKGVGLLYKKHDVELRALLEGGGQEEGLRPGTEALPLIVGFSVALERAVREHKVLYKRMKTLQELFLRELCTHIPDAVINGSIKERTPNNINISLPSMDAEFMVVKLDQNGVAASTASACRSQEGVSRVVSRLTKRTDEGAQALRFTFGRETTARDITRAVEALKACRVF